MSHSIGERRRRPENARKVRSGARTLIACVKCKEKKLKCDNKPSGCENCRRSGLLCLVEEPASKSYRPRNYTAILEQRVAYLESLLGQQYPFMTDDHPQITDLSPTTFTAPAVQNVQELPSPAQSRKATSPVGFKPEDEQDSLDELSSKAGLLSLNAAGAEPLSTEPYYLGSSSAFAFSRLINLTLRQAVNIGLAHTGSTRDPVESPLQPLEPCLLPSYDEAVKLSNAYFDNIHVHYPFLHEPTIRMWEEAILGDIQDPNSNALDPVPLFFLNMVYAMGALICPDTKCSPERLYVSAQLYIDYILPRDNYEAIQAILCCTMYSLRASIGTSNWKLAGLALRQCIDLGYHRSLSHSRTNADPLRLEMRKRVFWCAYTMESQSAIFLGRPQGIPFQEVDAEYPVDIDDAYITEAGICGTPRNTLDDPPTRMTAAIHTFRIRLLLSRIHSTIYSNKIHRDETQVQAIRGELEAWRAAIPPTLPCLGEALTLFSTPAWFDLEYHYAILQLYRKHIIDPQTPRDSHVFLDCLGSAESICHSYRRQFLQKSTCATWSAVHELFLAGLTYVHCLWTSQPARAVYRSGQVSSTCTDCIIVLVIIAERWPMAAPFRNIFEALANKTAMMMDSHNQNPNNSARSDPVLHNSALPTSMAAGTDIGGENTDLMQWMSSVVDAGISEDFHDLLSTMVCDNTFTC